MAASITTTNWKPTLNTEAGVKALEQYATNINKYGPVGSASFSLRRGFQRDGAGQGLQLHHLQLLPRRRSTIRASRTVVGKVEIMAVPGTERRQGRQPQRRLGLGDPEIEPQSRRGLDSSSSGSSRTTSPRSARFSGGSPTRTDVFDDAEVIAKYPYAPALKQMLLDQPQFPGLHLHAATRGGARPRAVASRSPARRRRPTRSRRSRPRSTSSPGRTAS